MRTMRAGLICLGVLSGAYGLWLLVDGQSAAQLRQVGTWALAGVILHDGVVAPLALALGWVTQRLLRPRWRGVAAVCGTVLGTLTVASFAVLTRSHAGGANGTLLDRDYGLGLLVWALVVIASATAVALVIETRGRSRATLGVAKTDGADEADGADLADEADGGRRSDGTGHGRR